MVTGGRILGSLGQALLLAMVIWLRPVTVWPQQRVELQMVLAIDTSTSVDTVEFEFEFELQAQGLSAAFRHPDVLRAIAGLGKAGLAVTLVQ